MNSNNNAIVVLLKDLIMEYDRVSLPCLGSFLSEYSSAKISNGKIYPPSKSIVFRQNEIWNDEKLENRIAQVNSVSIGVAKEELAFWIDNLCVLLATGENISLQGLGHLYVSKQEKLMFEQDSDNLLTESFGLEPAEIHLSKQMVPESTDFFVSETDEERKGGSRKIKSGTGGLIVGVLIIVILAAAAIFAIFKYILTDDKYLQPLPSETRVKTQVKTQVDIFKYEEYFTSEYGIVLSSFDKLSDARSFSKKISGTSVYCIDNKMPYSVILTYPSRESSNSAIDSLKTIYTGAYIIKLSVTP
jgi:hypothetical protein